ncbi:MAG TPA: hypothetical protein VFS77_06725, partial [Pyrinomonadaceae bacterium]|nr:hypothetical protein [Pyrinomonadaceae bacterium]
AQRKVVQPMVNHGPQAAIHANPAGHLSRPPVVNAHSRVAQPKLRPAASLPARTIQRQKADAQDYADKNGIAITASHKTVSDYVNNTANDKTKRKGLLDAWNLNNSRWAIDEPADFATPTGPTNPFAYNNFAVYQNWTNTTHGVTFTTPFGTGNVSGYHNHGAPKLGSNKKEWGNVDVGDAYVDYVGALRSGGLSDQQIATALLAENDSAFKSMKEKRAAAMIFSTVYLAEEWRKQGAAKIYRAMLRAIAAGTRNFNHFLADYKFIPAAQSGREMVARFYDVFNGDTDITDLSGHEQTYYNCLSPGPSDDWSSDDEMRTDTKKNLKSVNRLLAEKHTG